MAADPDTPLSVSATSTRKSRIWLAARIIVTVAAFVLLLWLVELDALWNTLKSLSPVVFLWVVALTLASALAGAVRWQLLLRAYGAEPLPTGRLIRLYMIGLFYNTYLPANVGGDVVRGLATRDALKGTAGGLMVVFVERVLGLAGLLMVCATAYAFNPIGDIAARDVYLWSALGIGGAIAGVFGLVIGRRLGMLLPGKLGKLFASLPEVTRATPFLGAVAVSPVTHLVMALAGYLVIRDLGGAVGVADAMVVVPLATAAAYFPLTVAGAGAREGAMVLFFGFVGVPKEVALAGSLAIFGALLIVAAFGGVIAMTSPVLREGA